MTHSIDARTSDDGSVTTNSSVYHSLHHSSRWLGRRCYFALHRIYVCENELYWSEILLERDFLLKWAAVERTYVGEQI